MLLLTLEDLENLEVTEEVLSAAIRDYVPASVVHHDNRYTRALVGLQLVIAKLGDGPDSNGSA